MAKKKAATTKTAKGARRSAPGKKSPAVRKTPAKKPAGKKKAEQTKSASKTKPASNKTARKGSPPETKRGSAAASVPKAKAATLGRPTLTADEPLYLVFKEDYHARQIFEFLRVQTVRELEEHAPEEIFKRLTKPVRESVDRIRRFLADLNRCLAGDEQFALAHKERVQAQEGLARNS
jgi:hypothetical protein